MEESDWSAFISLWQKEQELSSPSASSSCTESSVPQLKKLDDMVYEVYNPTHLETPELEVVFLHGLQLNHNNDTFFKTWLSRDHSQLWLQTFLVGEFPGARILIVSYDSPARKTSVTLEGRMDMGVIAESLLSSLTGDAVNVGQSGRPVVLVGHCLGGLVLKELCLRAEARLSRVDLRQSEKQAVDSLSASVRGMFFYGTPHSGSLMIDKVNEYIRVDGPILREMETLKIACSRRNENFQQLRTRRRWMTRGIGESRETYVDCIGKSIHVVPEASARLYMDFYRTDEADHYEICKPDAPSSSSFQFLADFLRQIINDDRLRAGVMKYTDTGDYVVDFEGRAIQVCRMLKESHAVFITGLSGIGKTTLARQVCQAVSRDFNLSCFISLVDSDGPEQLRSKLRKWLEEVDVRLKDCSSEAWDEIEYLNSGSKRVLIVVDNVKRREQLAVFDRVGHLERSWPGEGPTGSKLLVTTTNTLLPTSFKESTTYQVPLLSDRESRTLFLHYTFDSPSIEPRLLVPRVEQVILQCENFPLHLTVLGSFIRRLGGVQDYQFWCDIVERQNEVKEVVATEDPEDRLWTGLRPSYDALRPAEREMLLDAALVFYSRPLALAEIIWTASVETVSSVWQNLISAYLVSLDSEGRIWIQEQVRNLCRNMAHPPGSEVYRWTRIDELMDALALMRWTGLQETFSTQALTLETAQRFELVGSGTFRGFSQLKCLILKNTEIMRGSGELELPTSLIYLSWTDGVFETCPVNFSNLNNLVALELRHCRAMKFFPLSLVNMTSNRKLKWLDLEGCRSLTELPREFSVIQLKYFGLKNTGLQVDDVSYDSSMIQYLQASGTKSAFTVSKLGSNEMQIITSIDLSKTSVTELPDSIGNLRFLTSLKLDRTGLASLPVSIENLQTLKSLHLLETKVTQLPSSFGQLHALEHLDMKNSPLEELPESFSQLGSLKHLQLMGTKIRKLPADIGALGKLEYFVLNRTGVTELPESFSKLSRLNTFSIGRPYSDAQPRLPLASLERLSSLPNLQVLALSSDYFRLDIESSEDLATPGAPEPQESAASLSKLSVNDEQHKGPTRPSVPEQISDHGSGRFIFSLIPRLSKLRTLNLHDNCGMTSVPPSLFDALKQMPSLGSLYLMKFHKITNLPAEVGSLAKLQELHLIDWKKLEEMPDSLGGLLSLGMLQLRNMPSFHKLPESLAQLPVLYHLSIIQCVSLLHFPSSFGHFMAEAAPLNDQLPLVGTQKPGFNLQMQTDSWDLLQCSLECSQSINFGVTYSLNCREMDELGMPSADGSLPVWFYNQQTMDKLGTLYMRRRLEAGLPVDRIHEVSRNPDADDGGVSVQLASVASGMRPRAYVDCNDWSDESAVWTDGCARHPKLVIIDHMF